MIPWKIYGLVFREFECPGPNSGSSLDDSYQMDDHEFMSVEEYDDLINNPGEFFLTKVIPRKYKALSFLSELQVSDPLEPCSSANWKFLTVLM